MAVNNEPALVFCPARTPCVGASARPATYSIVGVVQDVTLPPGRRAGPELYFLPPLPIPCVVDGWSVPIRARRPPRRARPVLG